ncbi:MAG: hypothetical protein Q8P28_06460, partial [Deltaproteobacteria bacterium]|nr:hypothetical protein [Deltaproteobacteria bacterium]
PLLAWSFNWNKSYLVNTFKRAKINLIIIGAQTRPTVLPKIAWVREIVAAADQAGIPVFLKINLVHIFRRTDEQRNQTFQETFKWALNAEGKLRQEMPGKKG